MTCRPVSDRGRAILAAILRVEPEKDGWRRITSRDLHRAAGVPRTSCQREVGYLVAAQLVEVEKVGQSARTAEGFKVTPAGEELAQVGQSGPVGGPVRGPVLVGSSSPGISKTKREPTNQEGLAHADPVGQLGQSGLGQFSVTHEHRLCEEDRALLRDVLAALTTRPAAVAAAAQPTVTASPTSSPTNGQPSCACGPMKLNKNNEDGRRFWGCANYPNGCGAPTVSYTEPGSFQETGPTTPDTSEAARKERDEHRKRVEDERKARQKADDEAHAKRLRDMASKVKQAAKGGTSGADLLKVLRGEQGQGVA